MTEVCYLARGANPLRKPNTCEECFCNPVCKMFLNYQALAKRIENRDMDMSI